MTAIADIDEAKRAMRREATARRKQVAAPGDAAKRLIGNLMESGAVPDGAAVSGFWPIGSEIDLRPVLTALVACGHVVALPVVAGPGRPLVFRAWHEGDAMAEGEWGIREPLADAAEVKPQVLLVPLLAFDRTGYRLGYGGGFYDRTLARLRAQGDATAIGVAWAAQEVPAVPRGEYDQPLDWMLTERECFPVGGTV